MKLEWFLKLSSFSALHRNFFFNLLLEHTAGFLSCEAPMSHFPGFLYTVPQVKHMGYHSRPFLSDLVFGLNTFYSGTRRDVHPQKTMFGVATHKYDLESDSDIQFQFFQEKLSVKVE
jgi:hypothetical protein